MDFPQQTLNLVERISHELRTKYGDERLHLARGMYQYLRDRYNYGFGEGLEQGYFLRWPHEIKQEWECIEAAMYVYALAEALGLEPRMMSVSSWMGMDTGHETVDVSVDGHRVLIDPLNHMFGKVTYTDEGIIVEDNDLTERCILQCTAIEEVSRPMVISRMDYYRSDEGILNLLNSGQRLATSVNAINEIFVSFDTESQILEFQLRTHPPFIESTYYAYSSCISAEGVEYIAIEQGAYKWQNWSTLEGKEPFWRMTFPSGGESTKETFRLKPYGHGYLLGVVLYDSLMAQRYPERRYPEEENIPDDAFLFEDRMRPLEPLLEKIRKLEERGITPENKGDYNDLKQSHRRIMRAIENDPQMTHRILDHATMVLEVNDTAKELGVDPISIMKERMAEIGVDEKMVEAYRDWDPIGKSPNDMFPLNTFEMLFTRLNERGFIR